MAVKSLRNRGRTFGVTKSSPSGIGREQSIVGLGWDGMVGKAGDVTYLRFESVCPVVPNLGIAVQATGGVTIEYTLANPGDATSPSPAVMDLLPWGGLVTLAANDIQELAYPFTLIRVTWVDDAELYFAAR